ncbi:hypothetical protein GQ600_26971 [Phytophthora cactorum]|nr:hypothetical protein GQ600_26971 [Phytophthora cactorum]
MSTPEPHFNKDDVEHRLMLHPPTGKFIQVPVDHRTGAVSPPSSPMDELMCKYKGSRCTNPRSLKRNGELHNLCEYHRTKANVNQGRFDAKLRQRRDLDEANPNSTEASDLPEPIRTSEDSDSPTPSLNEWEAELLLKTIQDGAMDPNQHLRVVFDEDGHKLVELPTGGRVAVPYDPLYEAERAAAEAARAIDPPDELRCKYKSTRCMNLRAKKRNGELHNFCQMHRERANQNQRNSEQRKRNSKQPRSRRSSNVDNQRDHDPNQDDADEQKASISNFSPGTPQFHIPEPLQSTDGPHAEPTYDELKETAMLLSFPDRDRE